jgi:hypothetical protein
MAKWVEFSICPGCGYDPGTGEGDRSCHYGDCPYVPEELNVFCDRCRFNFVTLEGNPPCEDPMTCEHGVEARAHVGNVERWREVHGGTHAQT